MNAALPALLTQALCAAASQVSLARGQMLFRAG